MMLAALSEVSQDTDIPVIKRLLRAGDLNKQVEEVLLIVVCYYYPINFLLFLKTIWLSMSSGLTASSGA